jgi:methylsterol monooxygenase
MDQFHFVLYTISIIVFCNIFGFFLSIVSIHSEYLKKYRIQKRKIKASTFYNRLPLILFNIFLLVSVSSIGLYYLYPILFEQTLSFHFSTIIIQLLVILIIDDCYFYFLHYWMHKNEYILNKIHRIHHKAISPFALEYIYVHPLEWIMGYVGPFIALFVITIFDSDVSILAFWLYQLIRNIHELDVHSGFKSFFSKWIPFWGESEHHDMHHEKLNGNYATTFTIWDKIFNTKINDEQK